MNEKRTTYCGGCGHAGVSRQLRKHREMPESLIVFYVCDNPHCDKAEGTVIRGYGATLYSRRGGVGEWVVSNKAIIDEDYPNA